MITLELGGIEPKPLKVPDSRLVFTETYDLDTNEYTKYVNGDISESRLLSDSEAFFKYREYLNKEQLKVFYLRSLKDLADTIEEKESERVKKSYDLLKHINYFEEMQLNNMNPGLLEKNIRDNPKIYATKIK